MADKPVAKSETKLTELQVSNILTCRICTLADYMKQCPLCQFNIGTSPSYVALLPAYVPSSE